MAAADRKIPDLTDGAPGVLGDRILTARVTDGLSRRLLLSDVRALYFPADLAADVTGLLPIANGGTASGTAAAARTALGLEIGTDIEPTASPTFTGTATMPDTVFAGSVVNGFVNKVSTVTGALNAADHGGSIVVTSGNVTVPTTTGFTAVIIAGGAHTVTFNALTSAAMAAGDVMTVVVQSATIIKAVLTEVADLVSFS